MTICDHGNEVHPSILKAFYNMPASWYSKVASLDPDVCRFVTEASALREQASKLSKVDLR